MSKFRIGKVIPIDPDEQIEYGEDGLPLEMQDQLGCDDTHDQEFDITED